MRQVCLTAPAHPSSRGTLTRLPVGLSLGGWERNPVFSRGRRAEHVEGPAALGMSGSCWDAGSWREGN